jgi:Gpi18-like mannosyltransferase
MSVSLADAGFRTSALRTNLSVCPPRWLWRDVLLPLVVTRLALTLVGLVASSGNFVATWANWDAGWYLSIAQHGCNSQNDINQANTAFAPLLPVLMRLAGLLLGPVATDDVLLICGVIITNAALLLALAYLVALVREDFGAPIASRTALYALVFPSTLFLSAVYPHALFLAGAVGAFYHARREQWWLAGLFGALAALARVQGCIIVIPLAVEYLAARHLDLRRVDRNAAALLLPPVSIGLFAVIVWLQVGDPLAMLGAASQWQRHFGAPWTPLLAYLTQPLGAHGSNTSPLDLAFTLLLIGLVALSWVRVRATLALFATLLLLISLSSGLLVSSMRYGLELFPIFIALAISGRFRAFHYAYLAVSGYMALRFMSEFAQSVWVA